MFTQVYTQVPRKKHAYIPKHTYKEPHGNLCLYAKSRLVQTEWHWGWRLGSYKPPPLTNQNILPSRQPLQQSACLSKHWGGEDGPQLVLCRPLRGLSSNGFPEPRQRTEQKGAALVECTHQPITVTERH